MSAVAQIQNWMQAAILAGDAGDARAHVRGDNRLTAADRVGIYAQGYRARLIECLRSEYPLLAELAGPTAFDLFAQGYIAAHPSHSYTLYDFGAGFADYLERARPPGPAGAPQAVPAALARVERARAEVVRAHGVERIAAFAARHGEDPLVAALFGLDGRRYCRPDSLRLLTLPFDFSELLAAAARKDALPFPRGADARMAVARADYRVECHALADWQFAWLAGLDEQQAQPLPRGDARLAAWIPFAIARGFVLARD